MATIIAIAAAIVIIAPGAAGAAYLRHVLRRDHRAIWRPGDPLPDVPADAPIRHWESLARNARTRKTHSRILQLREPIVMPAPKVAPGIVPGEVRARPMTRRK